MDGKENQNMENMIAIEYIVIACFAIGFIALWKGEDHEPH